MTLEQSVDKLNDVEPGSGLPFRKATQELLPRFLNVSDEAHAYKIYPVFNAGEGAIRNDYGSLAEWIAGHKSVIIDGYAGLFWSDIKQSLSECFEEMALKVNWINVSSFLKSAVEVESMVAPFLGAADAVWGTRCLLEMPDFFDLPQLLKQAPDTQFDINVLYGTGAGVAAWQTPVIYIDLPKNELQFRMRAGSITNIGSDRVDEPFLMYKRFYFVDWVICNAHKKKLIDRIAIIADGQHLSAISWMEKGTLLTALRKMSESVIRVRPWFEPGAWGGQWIKKNIPGVNQEVVNYAWSFELIVPENGIILESNGNLLEVSFDFLMFCNRDQVLGKHAARFGDEFPIRFDFLDTVKGGNLSIQCHPRLKYIQDVFGETITQDETYYILDCEPEAHVFLGFQDDIEPGRYRKALEESLENKTELNITDYVQSHPAKKHDLFLIPNGTVHSAGAGNMVLEISATPYIFTFKMYDWLRLDLDGNPRPINIEHAFHNLDFERKGKKVANELISSPAIIARGTDWEIIHLPTHEAHFYDVHRIEFDDTIYLDTDDSCLVLMLVEGQAIMIETADGSESRFAYAETFVIPAAASRVKVRNLGSGRAKLIKAFIKN